MGGSDGGGGGMWLGGEEEGEGEGAGSMGWCVCVGGRRREEEGGRREGKEKGGREERATDSIEPQNSHKQSSLSGLVRHFHASRRDTEPILSSPTSSVKASATLGTYHRDAWLVIWRWSKAGEVVPSQAPPTSAISSDSPELKQTMFLLLGRRIHGDTTCFQQNL